MANFYNRLSGKFILALLFFLLILGAATAAVITAGFRQTQTTATDRSVQALQTQGRETLLQVTRRESQISGMQLHQALSLGRAAADFYSVAYTDPHLDSVQLGPLRRGPEGVYDANPDRLTDVWIDRSISLTAEIEENLRRSLVLDEIFPALMAQSADVIAIYFMDPFGATRYYPKVNIVDVISHDLVVIEQEFFRIATPENNPERLSVWTRPYMDYIGHGPIVTVSTPVYSEDTFVGVISVDVSLTRLIERLNRLTPTPGSYALLTDSQGRLVAAPPAALNDLLSESTVRLIAQLNAGDSETEHVIESTMGFPLGRVGNESFQQTLTDMRRGASGLSQFVLQDREVFLAYAPLADIGWSLAVVAPIAEITAESQAVAMAIGNEASTTVRWTLWITTILFGLALTATVVFTRRFLTMPIERLVAATQKVAAGDRSVSLPIHSQDELGLLADSFNRMTDQILQAQQTLEARVADRTRDLSALYGVTTVASRSLDQETVLNSSLDQVLAVMNCPHGLIHLWDDEEQVLKLAVQRQIPESVFAEMQHIPLGEGLIGWVAAHAEPLVLDDIAADPRVRVPAALAASHDRGFVGVPMHVKNRITGVLSIVGVQGRRFNGEEVRLLNSIADQVGVAVENARLYEQAEQFAVIEERQRLARELHDSVTQSLYSVNLMSETARRTANSGDLERTTYLVDRVGEMARQALKEMRLLVYELRPAALAQEGLVGALQQRLDTVEARAGVKTQLRIDGDPAQIPQDKEAHLYRIAQEALNNALKHAEASAVTVTLEIQDDFVSLTVKDNGKGFDATHLHELGGIGLKSMNERAQQLKGALRISAQVDGGATVCVCLPLHADALPIELAMSTEATLDDRQMLRQKEPQ